MNMLGRIAPPLVLLILAPLVAEYLLGDLSWGQIGALVALAPLYGGGAVLIREAVRRVRRGWPSFLLLALAYAIMEEGLLTQSLFNPNYLHLRLLDCGFVPALGTSPPWAIYVIGIHVIWSLAVPIGLAEALFPERRSEPWLGAIGLGLFALLFAAGMFAVSHFSLGQTAFRASSVQLALCAALIAALAVGAFILRPGPTTGAKSPIRPLIIGASCFAAGSAFLCSYALGRSHWPWPLTAAADAAVAAALCVFFAWAVRDRLWGAVQTFAAAAGGLLCYAWFGYFIDRSMHGSGNLAGHSLFVLIVLAIAAWAGFRAARFRHVRA
ncbi:MAG: hypothetical protein JWO81_1739 [Alphaproteobacteria bacterium]|nr:hypothetical protein [Alphaproteobacteria bacterium]